MAEIFQSTFPDNRNHHSCLHFNSTQSFAEEDMPKEMNLRKKIHQLLSDNFELKDTINRMQTEIITLQRQKKQFKQQLRIVLEQLNINDRVIEHHKTAELEYQSFIKKIEEDLSTTEEELQKQKQIVGNLIEHNQSLDTENRLLVEIKQKYNNDLNRAKGELEFRDSATAQLLKDNQILSNQVSRLLEELGMMEEEVSSRKKELSKYESYVLDKVSDAKNFPQLHEKCRQEYQRILSKYIKYKQKSQNYRNERDQLILNLQQMSKQMDSNTLRKYFTQE